MAIRQKWWSAHTVVLQCLRKKVFNLGCPNYNDHWRFPVNATIDAANLRELDFFERRLTWANILYVATFEKLVRLLCSTYWCQHLHGKPWEMSRLPLDHDNSFHLLLCPVTLTYFVVIVLAYPPCRNCRVEEEGARL